MVTVLWMLPLPAAVKPEAPPVWVAAEVTPVDVAGATGGKPRSAPDLSSCIAYVTEYAWEAIRDRHAAYRAGSEVGHNDPVSVLRTCHDCCPRVIDNYLKVS